MQINMVEFEDNELEISVVTYNRKEFVKIWLEKNYNEALKRNVRISVYDSSTNNETESFISEFNRLNECIVNYYRIPSSVDIGYKPMYPMLKSQSKYLWVSGDSRYHDFDELDEKVFPYIKKGYDYICLWDEAGKSVDGKEYTEVNAFIKDGFIATTCIGLSIYKTSLFETLRCDDGVLNELDKRFKSNFAFAWLGYFYYVLTKKPFSALIKVVQIHHIRPNGVKKVQTWYAKYYESWIENLCDLLDNIDDLSPETREYVIREVWDRNALHGADNTYGTRKQGILNRSIIKKYKANGMLQRVIRDRKHMFLVHAYAYSPMFIVEFMNSLFNLKNKVRK